MTATHVEIVIDASVAVRGLLQPTGVAAETVDGVASGVTVAYAPDLIVAEVTNALRTRVVARSWPVEAAAERLATFLSLPVVLEPVSAVAAEALAVAVDLGLSAYDAFYATLARELDVPLATADRRLAAAVPDAILVD